MGITLVLKHHKDKTDCICFDNPTTQYKAKVDKLLQGCKDGYACVTLEKPYKPRTTGVGSQNNLFWRLATIIANHTGGDISDVEQGLKDKAIAKGYPYHINPVTHRPSGDSMKGINTVEMSYLIDTAYEECAEQGIILTPNLVREKEEFDASRVAEEALEKTDEKELEIF